LNNTQEKNPVTPGFLVINETMRRGLVIFFIVAGWVTNSLAQQTFKVIVNQGSNSLVRSGESDPLKIGQTLETTDKLILGANGYIALISSEGATIELHGKDQETISLNDINTSNRKNGIIGKYADFLVAKMAPEAVEKNRKEYASVTGAVHRAIGIKAYMEKTSKLYESYAILRWDTESGEAPYSIRLDDGFGNQLFAGSTTKNYFKIDFMKNGLEDTDLVIVSFVDSNGVESSYSITREESTNESFESEISILKALLDDNSAFENLILAEFYEQHNFLLDASTCFEKAMILEPDVAYFDKVYIEFLKRNKFGDSLD